jgi:hypothetical protein
MAEILLCIRAKQLAFMTTNRALNNSFGSGGRRSIDNRWGVDIDWGHTLRLPLRQAAAAQIRSTPSNTQFITMFLCALVLLKQRERAPFTSIADAIKRSESVEAIWAWQH